MSDQSLETMLQITCRSSAEAATGMLGVGCAEVEGSMQDLMFTIAYTSLAGFALPAGGALASIERLRPRWLEQEFRHGVLALLRDRPIARACRQVCIESGRGPARFPAGSHRPGGPDIRAGFARRIARDIHRATEPARGLAGADRHDARARLTRTTTTAASRLDAGISRAAD